MNLNALIFIVFAFLNFNLTAQQEFREFYTNDSTEYILNNDTTIVVSKTKLYFQTNGGMNLLYDFSTPDSNMFIRDFDIITDSLWYLIFGSRYWISPSTLYKSIDKGLTWVVDSSIYNATQQPLNAGLIADENLYQLQHISDDTLLLFVSYYQSGIFYSINSGLSWDLWFANTPANYRGIFKCANDYFLWGQEGDGFPASMFSFNVNLLLSPDTNHVWSHLANYYHPSCYGGGNPNCIYAPNSMTGYDQFLFFENYLNVNCFNSPVGVQDNLVSDNLQIYPNPSLQGKFRMEWNYGSSAPNHYTLYTASGQLICSNDIQNINFVDIDLSAWEQGLYFLVVKYPNKVITKKLFLKK